MESYAEYTSRAMYERAEREERARNILATIQAEDIKKTYFKDFGTCNGWSREKDEAWKLAAVVHSLDMERCPENHEWFPNSRHHRGFDEFRCKCGFCWSVDSSD